ncbi:MAG: CDP-alcohol phosphatidyltransferase family protein [Saccharofermentanales bacterium]|jgi:CDP-diacylglycerol--glycerol-3-phosphate 3-phosphatidyltransferase
MDKQHMDRESKPTRKKHPVRAVFNVPNTLTLIRLLAIPVLASMILRWPEDRVTTFILFIVIWATDFLDGYIARRFNLVTEFGKLFDPFVDKVFQVTSAICMAIAGQIPVWVPVFYMLREAVMLIGAALILVKRDVVVYADRFGKLATFLFVVAMTVTFWLPPEQQLIRHLLFILPVLCSVVATIEYGIRQVIRPKRQNDHDADRS